MTRYMSAKGDLHEAEIALKKVNLIGEKIAEYTRNIADLELSRAALREQAREALKRASERQQSDL